MAKNKVNVIDNIDTIIANENVINTDISDELETSMLTYAICTIVSRAIPDARDGLKPVHRRVLYSALLDKLYPDRKYEKNVGVVGTTMKYFHPHGKLLPLI